MLYKGVKMKGVSEKNKIVKRELEVLLEEADLLWQQRQKLNGYGVVIGILVLPCMCKCQQKIQHYLCHHRCGGSAVFVGG
jgi:hypothetical protein